jgi:CBS domain-containing protein
MTPGPARIAPTASPRNARELMRLKKIRHLVVVEGSQLIGLVSAHDLDRGPAMAPTVAEVMSRQVVTVSPETTLKKAANLMRGRSVGSLVVTDADGAVVGIVTVADLLDLLGRGADRQLSSAKRPALHYRVPHRKQRRAGGAW